MAGGLVVHLWNAWAIQILVLLSFALQVSLLVCAGIRRRQASSALRLLIWLLYLVADSTAIYTLGHLSVTSSRSSQQEQHQLAAFWAPFLLLHLGGQDSITAYAFEDNRLWLRHLLTLLVQALAAAFVIYKYVAADTAAGAGTTATTTLLLADILVFIVGVLKYGERTWALKCGNMADIESTVLSSRHHTYKSFFSKDLRFPFPRGTTVANSTHDDDDEEFLLAAHCLLHMCKSLFAGVLVTTTSFQLATIALHTHSFKADLFKLVELELSLMYDIIYTKASVIHTWYGYCIRFASLLATLSAFLLFQFSSTHGYGAADVAITYILLVGALVLEIVSVCRAVGSTWMCALLYCLDWGQPLSLLKSLRRHVRAARKRRWSGSIGQFNIFDVCTRDTAKIASRVASKMGLKHWWNKVHFSGTVTLTASLKDLLLETLPRIDVKKSRGVRMLRSRGLSKTLPKWSSWTANADFEKSILVWHIATQVYLWESSKFDDQHSTEEARNRQQQLAEAIKMASDYMMFLLVAKPDMLPSTARAAHICNSEYVHSCKLLEHLYSTNHYHGSSISQQTQGTAQRILGNFRSIPNRESLVTEMMSFTGHIDGSACYCGLTLAEELLRMESSAPDLLEMVFEVWLQLLCHAAHQCARDSHPRQLNTGGEFITIVWLLTHHMETLGKTEGQNRTMSLDVTGPVRLNDHLARVNTI
ncbi:hypothetical protein SETIT_3G385400v2 [Setaria italica]|uniref:DUF4220 domain-containing protein n=1 Tax=Setaria italica TaxID=4555 RepID=K3Z493_SETIT|nr:uncharacterized protein LOC101781862 [Setaria italica]RCV19447.1 hypothetical protein SETIT_3G385400v2 [Setaria italica]RCV19448.1 hypothetical protein SETIT_3G385400v2 [Setaria italica]